MPKKIVLEESKINLIIERNRGGEGLRGLSKEFQLSRCVLQKILRENGYVAEPKTHNKITIPEKELKKYIARYNDNETLNEIAKSTPFTSCTLARKLKESGVELRPQYPTLTISEIETAVARYQGGEPLSDIIRDSGHGEYLIKKNLLNAGVKLRTASEYIKAAHRREGSKYKRKYSIDESVFDEITEESAYWIGFLMADGCISGTSVCLALQYSDIGHIKKFRKFLKSNHKIYEGFAKSPSSNNVFKNARFSFGSFRITERLERFGLIPAKSLVAKVKGLEFNRHFWRGVIDGDGTVGIAKRGNAAYISLVGSQDLMVQFLTFVKSITNTAAKIKDANGNGRTFGLSLSCSKAFEVISTLYDDCNIYLDRKYETVQKIKKLRAAIDKKNVDLDVLTNSIVKMYSKGKSGLKIKEELGISSATAYAHLQRHEKLTGKIVPRRHKTRQKPTGVRYREQGLCKDCGSKTELNRARCKKHLQKAMDYWRRKNPQRNKHTLI